MKPETVLLLYVVAFMGVITAVAIFYDYRRRRFGPTPTDDHIFRCGDCGFVYTDDPDVDRSRCPQCGKTNQRIKF